MEDYLNILVDIIGLAVDIVEVYILIIFYDNEKETKQEVSPNENADTENRNTNVHFRNETNDVTQHDYTIQNQHRNANISQPFNENDQQSNVNTENPSYANVHPFGCNNSNVGQPTMMGYMTPIVYHPQMQAGYSGFYGPAPLINHNQHIHDRNPPKNTKVIIIKGNSNENNYI
ncbi:unnamed protein product [Mytilus edulis]|uniref:Uncharacterized protein n=1 Tax=Mytilus edulis TaxID=6550 RepID=A0A8S3QMS4_MYTED|nr:unnamed protein product [Mytilus edulis]